MSPAHRAAADRGAADRADRVEAIVATAFPGSRLARRPCPFATSARLDELEVTTPDGRVLHLVAKHLGRRAKTAAAREVKPAALHRTGRELAVYRHVLAGIGLATPAFIGGWADERDGVVVLEWIDGATLAETGRFGAWEATARWLARLHLRFIATPPTTGGPRSTLARYDRAQLSGAGRRGLRRATTLALGPPGVLADLASGHRRAVDALVAAPLTLVHGDFYPSNVVVDAERIAVIDWELAGMGPAALDLAALSAGRWSDRRRLDLVRAYHAEAEAGGAAGPLGELIERVELASLHLALCWVGAAARWQPPSAHRRDWFHDAVDALARVERRDP